MNRVKLFLKNGLRTIKRERLFAAINILGLSLGIFCFLLTALYVKNEVSHDRWHANAEQIYLPQQTVATANGNMNLLPSFAIGKAWKEQSPGVVNSVNISYASTKTYIVNDVEFKSELVHFTTSALFEIFDFSLVLGNEKTALESPSNVVISKELAEKHFDGINPMGESIEVKGLGTYTVAGVLDKIPSNSHLVFEMLLPIDFNKGSYKDLENNWRNGNGLHYLQLAEGYSLEKLNEETIEIYKKGSGRDAAVDFQFTKFTDLYLNGQTVRDAEGMFGGQKKYITVFSVIGLLMLLVASFNYINLTTSRAISRSKELAIRKVVGAGRKRLIWMQLGETFFLGTLSLVLAIISLEIFLPGINNLVGARLDFNVSEDPILLALPVGALLLIVLTSGIYPAIIGSRFDMASLLKGSKAKSSGSFIRRSLIVLQFAICCGVLASALIIRGQANYMINKDLGFYTENIMSINMSNPGLWDDYEQVKAELSRSPLINGVSGAPIPRASSAMIFDVGEGDDKQQQFAMLGYAVKGYVDFFGLNLLAGNTFDMLPEVEPKKSLMVNEAVVKVLGLTNEEAIGYEIIKGKPIVGVLEDFHLSAAKNKIMPLLIEYNPESVPLLSLKFMNGNKEKVEAFAQQVWTDLGATRAFSYQLLDSLYQDSFVKEKTLVKIFNGLTLMVVCVACLGLFAVALLESQLKEKEMGIRKVLGATPMILMRKLNARFFILLMISLLVAFPSTQYLIGSWLDSFPYRIDGIYPFFIMASVIVVSIALLVLGVQGLKVINKNPTSVLRDQ